MNSMLEEIQFLFNNTNNYNTNNNSKINTYTNTNGIKTIFLSKFNLICYFSFKLLLLLLLL